MLRRIVPVVVALMLFAAVAIAADAPVTVHVPEFGTKMTPEQKAFLEAKAKEVYPNALQQVIDFVGNEKQVRKTFGDFHIQIRDAKLKGNHFIGYSAYHWRGGDDYRFSKGSKVQSIYLVGQQFLAHPEQMQSVLVHEMLHVVYEAAYTKKRWHKMADFVQEGISYMGAGQTEEMIQCTIQWTPPEFSAKKIMRRKVESGEKKRFGRIREVGFLWGFERVYGEAARKQVLTEMLKGKDYKKVFEAAAGKEWKELKKDVYSELQMYVQNLLDEGGDYKPIYIARDKRHRNKLIRLTAKFIEENPESVWLERVYYDRAWAFGAKQRYDEALALYEELRTGKKGSAMWDDHAASSVVKLIALTGQYDQARAKYDEFYLLYPRFWGDYGRKIVAYVDKAEAQAKENQVVVSETDQVADAEGSEIKK